MTTARFSDYLRERLWENGEFVLYRARPARREDEETVLLRVATRPSRESAGKLEHEFSLRMDLHPDWAVRPLALVEEDGWPMLVLDDPGGDPLDQLIRGPMELGPFLRLAVSAAGALRELHTRHLIHKDIKPANLLVDAGTGHVRLMGFGIASQLRRERQAPAAPETIAGSLPYMAPEQTGRMNRSVDARSDLYALGVTLYQMLTGCLPFTAADPLEWVHCHIARRPVPPAERLETVPAAVSAIVMKLLAKPAEERYQTAAGLEHDLRRCLAKWEAEGRIDDFPLGERDTPDRLLIPEKLYGRSREIESLLAAFDRIARGGAPELVLVSGYSGVGKTSVVDELRKVLVPPRGLFASGKFDQYKRDIPYATLAQAFQSLILPLLGRSEAELARWRDALREALDLNGQLIEDLAPELRFIIGEQPPVPELSPRDSQRRFQMVFRRFLGVFARPEHPLVLFLDDLHWLDAATLDLIEDLLTQSDLRHLLLIGAYRDNELDVSHPLMRKLDEIRHAGAPVQEITLAPLVHHDLEQFIADALRCTPERAAPLVQLVLEKTGGNPFFAIQFLLALAEEGWLVFDQGKRDLTWDIERIRAKGYTDNIVELMAGKLRRLPAETQVALQKLACLGNAAKVGTLSLVCGTTETQVHADLLEAVRADLVNLQEDSYRFIHDRVQEAAYFLIPEESRAETHLGIGRLLAAHTPPEKREEAIFEIVNQLNRGIAFITSPEEREQLAELNLIAGKRAKATTAYASALTYLSTGLGLLADDSWERLHELRFALDLHRAECEFVTGDLSLAEERLIVLSNRAVDETEQATVASLRIDLYTMTDPKRAVAVGLEYLRGVGIEWQLHPGKEDALREYEKARSLLGSRSIEELMDLPLTSDVEAVATIHVLVRMVPVALSLDPNLPCLLMCRAVSLILEHGNCDASPYAYAELATYLGPYFGDYRDGFRLAKLAYELVKRPEFRRFEARTYHVCGFLMAWSSHFRVARVVQRRAFEAANRDGDLIHAAVDCYHLNKNLLAAGDPLSDVQVEAEHGLAFARKIRFDFVVDVVAIQLALIRTLRGLTPVFGVFDDAEFDERRIEQQFAENRIWAFGECCYWIRKLQARFFAGDYAVALDAASRAERLLWTVLSQLETAEYHFCAGLSHAASCDLAAPGERQQHVEALTAHYRQIEEWAQNCPENFENRAALVGAEIARLEGRALDAMDLYEQAIRSAQANGFVQNEALAYELAARFYAARGSEQIADMYLRNARSRYARWGAAGKVSQLDRLYPHLHENETVPGPINTIEASVEHLDLATVVEVSQAITGEIVLEKLVETLLRTAIEQASAERGVLILARRGGLSIRAEANTTGASVMVSLRNAAVSGAELPESVIRYVARTHESVIIEDASQPNPFSADDYFREKRGRSVLCLPLVKQRALIALLYLENNLAARIFSSAQLKVLSVLASQAAMSLESSLLYHDLATSEAYLAEAQRLSNTGSFGWVVPTGEIIWSEETFRIFEYDPATRPTVDLVIQRSHPKDRALVRKAIDGATRDGSDFDIEHRLLMPDNRIKHLHVTARRRSDDLGKVEFIGAVRDVTAAKEDEGLQRSLGAIVETSGEGIILIDQGGGIEIFSRGAEHIFGYSAAEVMGRNVSILMPSPDRDRHDGYIKNYVRTREPRIIGIGREVTGMRKDGSRFPLYLSIGEVTRGEQFVGIVRDLTQSKKDEEERRILQDELAHIDRIHAMGEIATSIAHEVNQPLTAIASYAQACKRILDRDGDAHELLEIVDKMDQQALRGGLIIQRLREFVRPRESRAEPSDINALITEVSALCEIDAWRFNLAIDLVLGPDMPPVLVDRVQIQQVVFNLIRNAMEAMMDIDGENRSVEVRTSMNGDGQIVVAVSDNGPGLSDDAANKAFNPFFTTKESGMGMGLPICRTIIESHGGKLWLTRGLAAGATFCFALPSGSSHE